MTLTPRQREVARLVAEGLADKEIAARLGVKLRTVHNHLVAIRQKLELRSRVQVAVWVARGGLDK